MEVVLGIDIGTSGVRIAAVNRGLSLAGMSTAPIIAPLQDGGRIMQDPAIWWEATSAALRGLDLPGLVRIDGRRSEDAIAAEVLAVVLGQLDGLHEAMP